jgi:hypothetical protein
MSSKRLGGVDPLALFLMPQSPAERLATQQWGRVKLQRERGSSGAGRGSKEAKARGEAVKRLVGRP